jgi:RHH-type proline utilization regulon transcriptional repressor/proline dehydrogenase/delta 1-pyrroline-5-carboxylate dehydrogenase
MQPVMNMLREWLAEFQPDAASPYPPAVQQAVFLARRLQERASALQTPAERRQQAELDRLLQHPRDKATLVRLTDQAFRARDPHRAVDHLVHILDVQGVPRCFSLLDRTLLKGFQLFGAWAPGVALPLVKEHMHKETANVILPGDRDMLTGHLRARAREGVRMNVNFLGEAILGEEEAARRLEQYLTALAWPEIEVVSIKISTLCSQISALAREHTVATLCDRLARLFTAAARQTFQRPDGTRVPKFVYLDMEEYSDLALTAAAFMRTLDRPGLEKFSAGLALQSYIPDSFRALGQILAWARRRVAAGGAPVTVRLTKGANLEMERVTASLKGWPQAPYKTKRETDANYKRMLHELLKPENLAAARVGVASHNLFDLTYGLALAGERGALENVQFEMLEGMANHLRRALFALCHNVLLYAPACPREHFLHAIGYLIRRLDENTGPDNFLRHAFRLQVGSADWQRLEQAFLDSWAMADAVSDAPRRTQHRQQPPPAASPAVARGWQRFVNEPDTDFALPANSAWAEQIIARWEPLHGERAARIPLVVAGEEIFPDEAAAASATRPVLKCLDPSRPGEVVGRYPQANEDDVARAVECAARDDDGWRALPVRERSAVLGRVAQELRAARADLIGAALANGGKTIAESDPEVSEAVDFVEFYRDTARWFQELPAVRACGKGVVVVVSPWNFPLAIPCGGVAAALAAGNTVILKPSSDAVLAAWELCRCFWCAGVSRKALQFLPCSGGRQGRTLVNHPRVNAVILTGGTATALAMLRENPALNLSAETGGKNATSVTALADRDQAIKHVVHSAFSHGGQKCSATSLLLLEAEIYDDPQFRRALCDAVTSLRVGPAWKLPTRMGPLIRPPTGDLANALTRLDPGEEWAVTPRPIGDNPNLWSPGLKYGVRHGSYSHFTEFFGPVLGVMRFEKLTEAVAIVNQTGYGLTSGLESLDEREWAYWQEHIRAGNLYIHRVTTGAIVLRQPFGGLGKSAFGPGLKAGGPNYVAQFMDFTDVGEADAAQPPANASLAQLCDGLRAQAQASGEITPSEVARIVTAARSYAAWHAEEFGREHDHFRLLGQDNFRRYRPEPYLRLRMHPADTLFELFARVCATRVAGSRVTVSVPPDFASPALKLLEALTEPWAGAIEFVEETDAQLAQVIRERQTDRVRYAAPERVPAAVREASAETGVCVAASPVSMEGRVELLWYLREQSLSIDYHRYGNLGARAGEPRAEPR